MPPFCTIHIFADQFYGTLRQNDKQRKRKRNHEFISTFRTNVLVLFGVYKMLTTVEDAPKNSVGEMKISFNCFYSSPYRIQWHHSDRFSPLISKHTRHSNRWQNSALHWLDFEVRISLCHHKFSLWAHTLFSWAVFGDKKKLHWSMVIKRKRIHFYNYITVFKSTNSFIFCKY